MGVLKSFCIAFLTYSKIPMPRVYRNKKNMRFAVCFMPFIGVVIGLLLMLWFTACLKLKLNNACFAAVAAVIPIIITGGMHAGGFVKTNDAISARGSKQTSLEILGDPHAGVSGIVGMILYYLLYFGFLNEITIYGETAMIALGFVMSRSLCAIEMVLMRTAKNTGVQYEISSAMNKPVTLFITLIILSVCALVMIFLSPYIGGMVLFLLILLVVYYKFFVAKRVGGITSDTCGWFIQMCELLTLIAIVIGGKLAALNVVTLLI